MLQTDKRARVRKERHNGHVYMNNFCRNYNKTRDLINLT